MFQYVTLLLTLQPAVPPPPGLGVPHLPYLTAAGCEAAAARVALPPALRLVCVPVESAMTQLAAMY
jgi:hypothetical protein